MYRQLLSAVSMLLSSCGLPLVDCSVNSIWRCLSSCAVPWKAFYAALDSEGKVKLFQCVWDMCSDDERRLIVKDINAFFAPGGAEETK